MSLCDLELKTEYRSKVIDVVSYFFVPVLQEASFYKQSVGFFSSSSLIEISKGICSLVKNGGKIQLVTSPHLSEEDVEAIKSGYIQRNEIIRNALLRELKMPNDELESERLALLANLIAMGNLDIKVAIIDDGLGMYHEKLGLMEDEAGNVVAFSGSMNESETAIRKNYETIDVYCSWNDKDADRVRDKKRAFEAIWNGFESGIEVLEFPDVYNEIIKKYKRRDKPDFSLDDKEFGGKVEKVIYKVPISTNDVLERLQDVRIPDEIELRDYQKNAIHTWKEQGYKGIFDMATGTGKTLTALGAISAITQELNHKLGVVIVCPYQHLVEQWVEDIIKFNISPIVGYSSSLQKDWKKRLEKAIRDQKIREDKSFFCFICTNATFKNSFVQEQIRKSKYPLLLVVDEAHNFGATSYGQFLDARFTYRLALSATLDRHGDEEGTDILYNYFGKKCIEYSLEQAIEEDKLTPYKYYPIVVYLTEDELNAYEKLSYEMSKNIIKSKNGRMKLNKYGEILAIKRSRVIAGASNKLKALRETIQPYVKDNNILVYCGATNVIDEDSKVYDSDDMRQIEAVTSILGNEFGMYVAQFTSNESIEVRASIKKQFQRGDRLQAIVAIKCLDEGVNIPGIRTAFILASTTNPKEYIQRRGRVLRKAPNKPYAVIYDFVTLPRPLENVSSLTVEQAKRDISLVRREVERLKEFGCLSQNPMDANILMWDIQDVYHISDEVKEGEL